ncbi:MAG: ubiquinol-cytochrome c reductase iron-sulfur subunit [Acidimicrobiales bacterium]
MLFVVAVAVVAVLVIVFLSVTFSRRDRERATGFVSRETAKRDKPNAAMGDIADDEHLSSGRELERSTALARRGGDLVPAAPAPVALREPLDDDAFGVTRRQFLNRSVGGMFAFALSGFGAACIAFLWPSLKGGFGSKITVGPLADAVAKMKTTKEPVYNPEGRFYLNPFPKEGVTKAKGIASYSAVIAGYEEGVVALYQKCVHLGCRVPWCASSQWFECPCHGSQYNRVGEKKGGPAPRGLDRFAVVVDGGVITVDTSTVVIGPPIGTDTTGQQVEGPHCA